MVTPSVKAAVSHSPERAALAPLRVASSKIHSREKARAASPRGGRAQYQFGGGLRSRSQAIAERQAAKNASVSAAQRIAATGGI